MIDRLALTPEAITYIAEFHMHAYAGWIQFGDVVQGCEAGIESALANQRDGEVVPGGNRIGFPDCKFAKTQLGIVEAPDLEQCQCLLPQIGGIGLAPKKLAEELG